VLKMKPLVAVFLTTQLHKLLVGFKQAGGHLPPFLYGEKNERKN